MEKTSKLIKITASCKERLEKAKGLATFSDFISDMLSYFEMIKLDPKSAISNPTTEFILHIDRAKEITLKRMEDVIKIIRNIETTKLAGIVEKVSSIESLLLGNSTGLSIEQIQEVVNENQRLHDDIEKLKFENQKILESKKRFEVNAPGNNTELSSTIVRRVKAHLDPGSLKKTAQKNEYIISQDYINAIIEDLESRIK